MRIGRNLFFDYNENIIVENNVRIGNNCRIFGKGGVQIRNNILISDNVTLASATHNHHTRTDNIAQVENIGAPVN